MLVYRLIIQKCCWCLWEGSHGNIRIDLHLNPHHTHTGRCAARNAHMYIRRNIEMQVLHGSIAHFQFFRSNSLSYTVLQPTFPTVTVSNSALTHNSALGSAKINVEPIGRFGHTSWSNALEWLVRRVLRFNPILIELLCGYHPLCL